MRRFCTARADLPSPAQAGHLAFRHDFSKFAANAEDERKAIAALASVLDAGKILVVTSGTGLAAGGPGQLRKESDPATSDPSIPRNPETVARAAADRGVHGAIVRLPQVHDTRKQGLVPLLTQTAREKGVSAYGGDGANRGRRPPVVHGLHVGPGCASERWPVRARGNRTAFADDLTAATPSTEISFLPFEDNYLTAHGGLALLTAPEHHERALPVWGSTRKSPLAQSKQIPLRPILVGPCIVGFWEYDPNKQRVVHATFAKTAARAALSSAAESLTAFLRDKLQHGRSFSLDTDDELRTRTEQVLQVRA